MEPVDQIRKDIHTALSSVSQLCEKFFRKYPQHYPPTTPITPAYQPHFHGTYLTPNSQATPVHSWSHNYDPNPSKQLQKNIPNPKYSQPLKNQVYNQPSKKIVKQEKKYQKNIEKLRIQREKEELRLKQITEALKKKKKQRNTKKNLIKKDPRYAQRPKFPMSPYFLFLKEMRASFPKENPTVMLSNKLFAQKMGQKWRQMDDKTKKPYIQAYLAEKNLYDEKLGKYYEKYPDLRPKVKKHEKPMYSVDDPKYHHETGNDCQELQADLIDELPSEEEPSDEQEVNSPNQDKEKENGENGFNEDQKNDQEEEYESEWSQQKDSLGQERATADNNGSNPFREVVQID